MAESIVKVPSNAGDMDFLAFSFNGKHSWDDFGIIRTSDGDRYNENLVPTMQDKTAEVPGGDGMYYFGTTHKQREFNINIAFDNMSEIKYREMRQWLNGKEMGDLWFSEAPYKVYTVKPTGTPSLKTLCFDRYNETTKQNERVYKGEGTIQFTAYWPYAHTPDFVSYNIFNLKTEEWFELNHIVKSQYFYIRERLSVRYIIFKTEAGTELKQAFTSIIDLGSIQNIVAIQLSQKDEEQSNIDLPTLSFSLQIYTLENGNINSKKALEYWRDGKLLSSYTFFGNKNQWAATSGLLGEGNICVGENPGDIPAPFVLTMEGEIANDQEAIKVFKVGSASITIYPEEQNGYYYKHYKNLTWDSKSGLVSGYKNSDDINTKKPKPLPYTGNSLGAIPPGGLTAQQIELEGAILKYHYWYY